MTEVYKIGVKLAMTSNAPAVVSALSKQLLGVNVKVKDLTRDLGRLKLAIGGAFAGFAADKLLMGLTGIVTKTKDLSHELTQLQKMGLTPDQLTQAQRSAIQTTRDVLGVTQVDALKAYGSVFSMVGHSDALKLMKPLEQYAQVVGNTTGNYDQANAETYKMIRAADLIGRLSNPLTHDVDLDRLQKFLNLAAKVNLATHGAVGPQTWLGLASNTALTRTTTASFSGAAPAHSKFLFERSGPENL
jgi:hypothetical protein